MLRENPELVHARSAREHHATLDLEGAAGVGRLDLVKNFFDADGSLAHHRARPPEDSSLQGAPASQGRVGIRDRFRA